MSLRTLIEIYNFVWSLESHAEQRLAWDDAAQARIARERAEADAENVSAVLFSNSGTIAKFNRIGALAGFGSERLRLVRVGTAVNLDPNAAEPFEFRMPVNDPRYRESWREGIDIWHNPNATHPLDPRLLPGVGHHRLLPDGTSEHFVPRWDPLASVTLHWLDDNEQQGQA